MDRGNEETKMNAHLPNGKVTDVDFEPIKEDWNEYKLEDGTVLKFKTVVRGVIRTDSHDSITGDPIYQVRSTNIVRVKVPEELKKLPPKNNLSKEASGMEVG